jgi:acylpyruvate hydrolase
MRLVTYSFRGECRLGVVQGEAVVDLTRALARWYARRGEAKAEEHAHLVAPPGDMVGFLAGGPEALSQVREALAELTPELEAERERGRAAGILFSLSEVKLEAPVRRPGKIACLWVNYVEHGNEAAIVPPTKEPVFFSKFSDVVVGPGDPIQLPRVSRAVDYEAELALVIGRTGKHIPEEQALEYVAGYTILNDVSARDFNLKTLLGVVGPYIIQKTFDTFAPMGPYLVTRDEVPDPHALRIRLWIDGELMQDGTSGDMIFKIPRIISYLSRIVTLRPGDVISTGTPPGVGHWRTPPRYLRAGETVRIEIERLGVLENPVVQEGEG